MPFENISFYGTSSFHVLHGNQIWLTVAIFPCRLNEHDIIYSQCFKVHRAGHKTLPNQSQYRASNSPQSNTPATGKWISKIEAYVVGRSIVMHTYDSHVICLLFWQFLLTYSETNRDDNHYMDRLSTQFDTAQIFSCSMITTNTQRGIDEWGWLARK